MTITCPNCRTDFRSAKLSTEKVNVVVCPHCRMIFPYTVKQSSLADKNAEAPQPAVVAYAEPAVQKKNAAIFGNYSSHGSEDFLRLKELEEKRELLRRERELRYEQKALEYRIKLIEEKERLERREQERRRALEEMEGFIRVGVVTLPTEIIEEPLVMAQAEEQFVVEETAPKFEPKQEFVPEPEPVQEKEIALAEEEAFPVIEISESTPAQVAFEFDKAAVVESDERKAAEKETPAFTALESTYEATPAAEFSAEAEDELKLYEDREAEIPYETTKVQLAPEPEPAPEPMPEQEPEPVAEPEADTEIEVEAESVIFETEMSSAETLQEVESSAGEEQEYEEYETVVVEVEEGEDEEETVAEVRLVDESEEDEKEIVAEVRLVEDAEEDYIVEETRLFDEKPSAESISEVEAVIERMRLIEEEAHAQAISFAEEPAPQEQKPEQAEPPYYASGETVTEHGIARVIVTGVKMLDEEAPPEETQEDSVERFFAQVENEAESVSDSELEESLKADVDQVVSEIEDMSEVGAQIPASFERSDDTNIIALEQPAPEAEPVSVETRQTEYTESTETAESEVFSTAETEKTVIEAEVESDKKIEYVTVPVPTEPVFTARPIEMSPEEIQLRQEQEKSRRRATQQFYSNQFDNIKMQRDLERRIMDEKERLAAEAAAQKNPAGTELSRMKRNLQIGATLFAVLIAAQVLIYFFGSGN